MKYIVNLLIEMRTQTITSFFISAPFGNYLNIKNSISVTGSWTLNPRPGRATQILKTLRYTKSGWRNKLGLRNPGIMKGLLKTKDDQVLSIASIERDDWYELYSKIPSSKNIEVNISCPNVEHNKDILFGLDLWASNNAKWRIIKVPPNIENKMIDFLIDLGYSQIHASNTLPTDKGGLSGNILKPYTLKIIDYIKKTHPHVEVIAGGGVNTVQKAQEYLNAGADYISLGTVCFTPWKLKYIINYQYK